MFEKLVMDGLPLMTPPETWVSDSMLGLLEGVREYDNSPAAIGYTVYYYAHDMEMAQGTESCSPGRRERPPAPETIRSRGIPLPAPLLCCPAPRTRREDSPARILYDWLLGEEGQSLVAQEGYVSILEQEG